MITIEARVAAAIAGHSSLVRDICGGRGDRTGLPKDFLNELKFNRRTKQLKNIHNYEISEAR